MSARPVIGFLVKFLLAFVALMVLWRGVGTGYAEAFRTAGNLLFARFGSDGLVDFQRVQQPTSEDDLRILLMNRRNNAQYTYAGSSRLQGYKPTAFLLALILATPVSWKRRGRAVLWGLLWVNLYIAFKTWVFILARYCGSNELALYAPGALARALLDYLEWLTVISFAAWLIIPLPIWALVTFRRDDWPSILQAPPQNVCEKAPFGRE